MTDETKNTEQADDLDALASAVDTFDDAERRELLKRIGKVGLAAVPTAIVLSSAPEAAAASISDSGGGGLSL